jgi:hypothetical protein
MAMAMIRLDIADSSRRRVAVSSGIDLSPRFL